jgi:uncharacterized protein (TIGR03086 family)
MTAGVELLERAMGYTLGCLQLVTPEAMSRPTPCVAWDLRALLRHMSESLLTLHEAIARGQVVLDPAEERAEPVDGRADLVDDPVSALRDLGCRMIGSWTRAGPPDRIEVADRVLPAPLVAATGAVEVAVHGWDVARACGRDRPVPPALAAELLGLCRVLVHEADRPGRFARPVPVSASAPPSDRLIAFTGRLPR